MVVAVDVAVVMVMVAAVVNVVAVVVVPAIAVVADHCDGGGDGGCGLPPQVNSWFPHRPARQSLGEPPCPQVNPWFPHPSRRRLVKPPKPPNPPDSPKPPEPPGPTPQSISQPGFPRRRTRQLLGLSSPEAPFVYINKFNIYILQ